VKVTRRGSAAPDARVSFAGATARTGRRGTATISTLLETSGWFKAVARQGNAYGLSELAKVSP
jgi:hypothetical protein